VICLAGSLGDGAERVYECGIDGLFSIIDKPMDLKTAMDCTEVLLERSAQSVLRFFLAVKGVDV